MKVYIAGPISDIPNDEVDPPFNAAAARWRAEGWEVFNPVELDNGDHHALPWIEYLARDLPELIRCDAIAMLPGWENSRGARIEYTNAGLFGLRIFDANHPAPLPEEHEFVDGTNECCIRPDYAHLPMWRHTGGHA